MSKATVESVTAEAVKHGWRVTHTRFNGDGEHAHSTFWKNGIMADITDYDGELEHRFWPGRAGSESRYFEKGIETFISHLIRNEGNRCRQLIACPNPTEEGRLYCAKHTHRTCKGCGKRKPIHRFPDGLCIDCNVERAEKLFFDAQSKMVAAEKELAELEGWAK